MTADQQFSRTVRIAIPLQDEKEVKARVPKIAKPAKLAHQTSWIVTQTGETGADRYQELLHSLYDGVIITKASGQIVDINARALSLLHYEQNELSRLNVLDIIAGANEQLLQTIFNNIESNRFTLIDGYCVRKDKTTFPAEIATNRLVLTQEGHLCFFVRDVTKRKKAEEELIQTVSKLRELDNAKTRLVANVSHELRTPLTIISSFVSLVHDGIAGNVSDQQKECLSTVLRNCDRLANLIDDILDLGRIESGREEFKRRRLNLPDLLRQCHHDFLPKILLKHQQLNLEIPEGVPDALGDSDKIAQVLTNLVGNANKFTPEGGEITVSLIVDGENACIDVVDNGPGIAPNDQSRLFEAFTQVDRPEGGSGSKGTGLGLTISKHIIEAHDGVLKVESTPGRGSRFYFTLPLYNEQNAFKSFLQDRLRFMQSRNRNPMMLLLQCQYNKSADKDAPSSEYRLPGQSLLSAVVIALGCTELQAFWLESENSIVALTDRTDLNKETIVSRLQAEIGSRVTDNNLSLSLACLRPDKTTQPHEWLAQAKNMLEPLPIMPGLGRVRRILIVDDDAPVLKMITDLLGKVDEKFDIKSTTSGYDACIHFGNWKPDLVILDLHLPDIDGKKVFQSMIKGDHEHRMKFLAVSGYPDDIKQIMAMGCDDSLEKPFDYKQFIAKVRYLLAASD